MDWSCYFARHRLRFWMLIAGSLLSALAFQEVVDDVFFDPLEGDMESEVFDENIMGFMNQLRRPSLTQAMTDLTALGSVSVIFTFYILIASILLIYRKFKGLAYLSLVLTGAGLIPMLLKLSFNRARPDLLEHLVYVSDLSFPSGHAFGATAIYIALAYYSREYAKNRKQELFFYLLSALLIAAVGFSRIYLGVHYPTDVLGGISAGSLWALSVSATYEFILPHKNRPGLEL